MEPRLWSIVLAANGGQPLSPRHEGRPEQHSQSSNTTSLVQQTIARLGPICPADRTVIVLNEGQRENLRGLAKTPEFGRMVFQPDDRGTAAGLLFGLLPVLTSDPAAVVLVTPLNRAVANPDEFEQGISDAVSHARRRFGVALFGVERTSARANYRWALLGSADNSAVIRAIGPSTENPSSEVAGEFPSAGASWNTLVIVAPARALLHLCRQRLPVVSSVFVAALTMPSETRGRFLTAQYPQLPSRDLAQHVLMASGNPAAHTWPSSIGGPDLGTSDQLGGWLRNVLPREQGRRVSTNPPADAATTATRVRRSSEPAFTLK